MDLSQLPHDKGLHPRGATVTHAGTLVDAACAFALSLRVSGVAVPHPIEPAMQRMRAGQG